MSVHRRLLKTFSLRARAIALTVLVTATPEPFTGHVAEAARAPEMALEVLAPVWKPWVPFSRSMMPWFPVVVRVKGKGDIVFDENGIDVAVRELSGHDLPGKCADKRSHEPHRRYVLLRAGESRTVLRIADPCGVAQRGRKYQVVAFYGEQSTSEFGPSVEKPNVPAGATLIFNGVGSRPLVFKWAPPPPPEVVVP